MPSVNFPASHGVSILIAAFLTLRRHTLFMNVRVSSLDAFCGSAAERRIHFSPTNPQSTLLLYSMFCLKLTIFQWEYPTIADRHLCGRRRNRTSITLKTIGCFIVSFMPHFSTLTIYSLVDTAPVAGAGNIAYFTSLKLASHDDTSHAMACFFKW